jgi:hypothetical protein
MDLSARKWGFTAACAVAMLFAFGPEAHSQTTSLDSIRVVPNPYNVSGRTYGQYPSPNVYRVYFRRLPRPCTVKIYSSDANLVNTLTFGSGYTSDPDWNLRNSDNQLVASDVYFYVVEHATLGTKIGKFVVIR